ncbi:MAG: alkaline phosphatase family protein, partial [Chloroflexota bacterium]
VLQNPRADAITLNYAVIRPQVLADLVQARFGAPPPDSRPATGRSDWVTRVLLEHLLPDVLAPAARAGRPALAYWWLTDPDHTAHHFGLGAPETVQSLRENDRRLGELLGAVDRLGLLDETDVLLTADHGFSTSGAPHEFEQFLAEARAARSLADGDLVSTGEGGGAISFSVAGARHAPDLIGWLQRQDWVSTIFVRDGGPADGLAGTLPLSLAWNGRVGPRAPDVQFSPGWTDEPNAAGIPGRSLVGGGRGARHGSSSPYDVRNSLVAWGSGFKRGIRSSVPCGIVDVAPTVRHLLGLPAITPGESEASDGRVLAEALRDGLAPTNVPVALDTREASATWRGGAYRQRIDLARVGATTYFRGGQAERT